MWCVIRENQQTNNIPEACHSAWSVTASCEVPFPTAVPRAMGQPVLIRATCDDVPITLTVIGSLIS